MTIRIELQCDVCRTAYFKHRTGDVAAAREAAEVARWSWSVRDGTRTDICPRCTVPSQNRPAIRNDKPPAPTDQGRAVSDERD